jgi:hypothetical protein
MAEGSAKVVEFLSVFSGAPADDGQLAFNTGRDTSNGPALDRDSRVVSCVDDPHPPYSSVAGCTGAKKKRR